MCCSKGYPELKEEPCDDDHYCNYVDWPEYNRIQTGGIICTIILTAISVSPRQDPLSLPTLHAHVHARWRPSYAISCTGWHPKRES